MNFEHLVIEMDSDGLKDEIDQIFKHPMIQDNFEKIAKEKLSKHKCLIHDSHVSFDAFESDNQSGFQLKCCCDEYGSLATEFLGSVRHELWKLCLVLAVTHKKIGCDQFNQLIKELEAYKFKSKDDFFDTFFRACIEKTIFDDAGEFIKQFKTMAETSKPIVH